MALAPCRECGQHVSTEAPSCPHCGVPSPAGGKVAVHRWGRAYRYPTGFSWRTEAELFGLPLVAVAFGRDDAGRRRVARGVLAIGQYAVGLFTVAQFGAAAFFGFGQFIAAPFALSQFALALAAIGQMVVTAFAGVGQMATGYVAVGQGALGWYVRCQFGLGAHVWSSARQDPEAVDFFRWLGSLVGI